MKHNRNTAIDYRDYFHGFIEKLDKDSMEREERFTNFLKESEARIAADRKAAEERLERDRKAAEERLVNDRKDANDRLEKHLKSLSDNHKQSMRWLVGLFITLILGLGGLIFALSTNGYLP